MGSEICDEKYKCEIYLPLQKWLVEIPAAMGRYAAKKRSSSLIALAGGALSSASNMQTSARNDAEAGRGCEGFSASRGRLAAFSSSYIFFYASYA